MAWQGKEVMTELPVLIVSNLEPGDDVFTSDQGHWNVSRAQRDVAAGLHRQWRLELEALYKANQNVECSSRKVKAFTKKPEVLEIPLIAIEQDGRVWLIDGHHRLRALYRLGESEVAAYVIEEKDSKPYQVFYNGQRLPPWEDT